MPFGFYGDDDDTSDLNNPSKPSSRWECSDIHEIYPTCHRQCTIPAATELGGEVTIQTHETKSYGDRHHMEDYTLVDLRRPRWEWNRKSPEASIFAVFDGHGGHSAATFAKDKLWELIRNDYEFWSEDPQKVCEVLRRSFRKIHEKMWEERPQWPTRSKGLLSTSGTTASIVILKVPWVFTAHVGDSGIVLAVATDGEDSAFSTVKLTQDHKPNHPAERSRIEASGGKVMLRKGVHRVVWTRSSKPLLNTSNQSGSGSQPSTEEIPFLAMSRALGDLWSYNKETDKYSVSPEPDVDYFMLCPHQHKFLILGSDGLWNMMKEKHVVRMVQNNIQTTSCNISELLCQNALDRWRIFGLRADNISSLVVSFTPLQEIPANCCEASPKTLQTYEAQQQQQGELSVLTTINSQNNSMYNRKRKSKPHKVAVSPRKLRPRLRSSVRIQSRNRVAAKGPTSSLFLNKMAGSSYSISHCRSILL